MWAILLIGQCFSRASCRCSSYNLLLGSFNMVDLRLWDALSRWQSSWRVFTPPMCMPIIFGLGTSTHVCSQSMTDHYFVKQPVSHAWCWFWTIRALVEAQVLWWLYSNSQGHNSSVDHCQTFSVFIIRLAKKPVLKAKCFTDTGCACTSSVANKRAIIKRLAKNLFWEKNCVSVLHFPNQMIFPLFPDTRRQLPSRGRQLLTSFLTAPDVHIGCVERQYYTRFCFHSLPR